MAFYINTSLKNLFSDELKDVKTYQKLKANWAFSITYNLNK